MPPVWTGTRLTTLLGIDLPIVQAPMAGWTPPALVAAVSEAGALGSLGGARMAPADLRDAIRAVKALTSRPFGVNLFAPAGTMPGRATPPFTYGEQLEVVLEERVPVFSFTFGIAPDLDRVRDSGALVLGTATTAGEAVALEDAGCDAVVLQGVEAGGHRGTFAVEPEHALVGLFALVRSAAAHVSLPLVAAGAVVDGAGLAAALALGADGVQVGSAFLACDESGAPETWRSGVPGAPETASVVTDALTGRHARALHGRLVDGGEAGQVALFAGQAAGLARAMPAARLVETLVAEADAALARLR